MDKQEFFNALCGLIFMMIFICGLAFAGAMSYGIFIWVVGLFR